jgi:hypothetical protein
MIFKAKMVEWLGWFGDITMTQEASICILYRYILIIYIYMEISWNGGSLKSLRFPLTIQLLGSDYRRPPGVFRTSEALGTASCRTGTAFGRDLVADHGSSVGISWEYHGSGSPMFPPVMVVKPSKATNWFRTWGKHLWLLIS